MRKAFFAACIYNYIARFLALGYVMFFLALGSRVCMLRVGRFSGAPPAIHITQPNF